MGSQLPADVVPSLSPISSVMGEIMLISLASKDGKTDPLQLRTLADWIGRQRLLSVAGVSLIIVLGGGRKQYQVPIEPAKLWQYGVSLQAASDAVERGNVNMTSGFIERGGREYLVRNLGRAATPEDIARTTITSTRGLPITVGQVAQVVAGPQLKRGDASANGAPAVIHNIQKQPGANTLLLTEKVDAAIADIKANMPAGVEVYEHLFRQANFIETAIENVIHALRDAGIMVAIDLFYEAAKDGQRVGFALIAHADIPGGEEMHVDYAVDKKFTVIKTDIAKAPDEAKMAAFINSRRAIRPRRLLDCGCAKTLVLSDTCPPAYLIAKLEGSNKTHFVAITCSARPERASRGPLKLVRERLIQFEIVEDIGLDTIRERLRLCHDKNINRAEFAREAAYYGTFQ